MSSMTMVSTYEYYLCVGKLKVVELILVCGCYLYVTIIFLWPRLCRIEVHNWKGNFLCFTPRLDSRTSSISLLTKKIKFLFAALAQPFNTSYQIGVSKGTAGFDFLLFILSQIKEESACYILMSAWICFILYFTFTYICGLECWCRIYVVNINRSAILGLLCWNQSYYMFVQCVSVSHARLVAAFKSSAKIH
jgi:hypothetical protein